MQRIGEINVDDNLVLTNPLTDIDGRRALVLDNMEPGKYVCFATSITDLRGSRITSVNLVHEKYLISPPAADFFDSATESAMGIMLAEYYYDNCANFLREHPKWLDACLRIMKGKKAGMLEGKGVFVMRGYEKDRYGQVQCFVGSGRDGKIAAVYLEL